MSPSVRAEYHAVPNSYGRPQPGVVPSGFTHVSAGANPEFAEETTIERGLRMFYTGLFGVRGALALRRLSAVWASIAPRNLCLHAGALHHEQGRQQQLHALVHHVHPGLPAAHELPSEQGQVRVELVHADAADQRRPRVHLALEDRQRRCTALVAECTVLRLALLGRQHLDVCAVVRILLHADTIPSHVRTPRPHSVRTSRLACRKLPPPPCASHTPSPTHEGVRERAVAPLPSPTHCEATSPRERLPLKQLPPRPCLRQMAPEILAIHCAPVDHGSVHPADQYDDHGVPL